MKKILAWILALVLIAVAAVVGTVAYLKDVDSADNVMTLGEVHIALREYERKSTETADNAAVVQQFNNNKPLLPAVIDKEFDYTAGDTYVDWDSADNQIKPGTDYTSPIWDPSMINNEVDKMVFVENTGDYSAYVRIYFAFEAGNFDTFDEFQKKIHINLNDDADEWVWEWVPFLATNDEGGKYFIAKATYQKVLDPGKLTEISLSQIALDSLADNEDVAAFGKTYEVFVNAQGIQSAGFTSPEQALEEGFGSDIPFDMTLAQGVSLCDALHYLDGNKTGTDITQKVTNVTFGLNKDHSDKVSGYEGTLTSVEQDAMVYTYYVPNATNNKNYDVYVLADDTIYTPKDSTALFKDMTALTKVDTANMDVSRTENMTNMFRGCKKLTDLNVSNWKTGNVNSFNSIFRFCHSLPSLDVSKWDTSSATDMMCMFDECKVINGLDVSGWDVSNVTNMLFFFYDCEKLTSVDVSKWDVGKVEQLGGMFERCYNLAYLNVSNWDVRNAYEMSLMFHECRALEELDLSGWKTDSMRWANYMFEDCSKLKNIRFGDGWNTSNTTHAHEMFNGCSSLTTLDVSNWNTSNTTHVYKMFNGCSSLTTLDVSSWDTTKFEDVHSMFSGCTSLTTLDVSKWNTAKVTSMEFMFNGCTSLTTLDVSNWNTAKVTSMEFMFNGCVGLTELDLSNWNTALVKDSEQMFAGCSKLKTIYAGDGWNMSQVEERAENKAEKQEKLSSDNMFDGCVALEGGAGTKYNETNPTNKTYAIIDGENPGYLTYKPAAESTNP